MRLLSDEEADHSASRKALSGQARQLPAVLDPSPPRCQRRCTGQPVSPLLKKSQGERLSLIAARNRWMAADDARNLLLERLGLIERVGDGRLHPLHGHPIVAWRITDAGMSALSDIRDVSRLS